MSEPTNKFRKRPVVIEAVQFTEALAIAMLIDKQDGPFGLHASGSYHPEKRKVYTACIYVDTLKGKMRADLDDWIIRGVKSELYPCKPEIFAATYESADTPVAAQRDDLAKRIEKAIVHAEANIGSLRLEDEWIEQLNILR